MTALKTATYRRSSIDLVLICMAIFVMKSAEPTISEVCDEQSTHCAPGLCADRIAVSGYLPSSIIRTNCRCDKRCSLYGDCCVDYWDRCLNATDPPISSSKYSKFFKCISPFALMISYVAVGRCPTDWPQETIRQNCENETLAKSEKLLALPINGPDEIVFKNIYCAMCHGIPLASLEPWSLELSDCLYDELNVPEFDTCSELNLKRPVSMSSDPHRCYQDFRDTCPPAAAPNQIALCENNTSIVFRFNSGGGLAAFRNIYCVDCNHDPTDVEQLLCNYDQDPIISHTNSFILLFDFTEHTVHACEGVLCERSSFPQILGNCSRWQIHDPFLRVCRNLSCPVGMTLHSGQCVESWERIIIEQSLYRNHTGDCLQELLSSYGITDYLGDNCTKLLEFSMGSTTDDSSIYIHADFSIAGHIQDILDRFVYDGHLVGGASHPCNSTTFMLVASSLADTNRSWLPICEGFTLHDIRLDDAANAVFFDNSTWYYEGLEVLHVTVYASTSHQVSNFTLNQEYVRLCSPFVGTRACPVLAFNQRELLLTGSGKGALFVHKASGKVIPADGVWQLPDGTLRTCNFLTAAETVDYPAWITILSNLNFAGGVCSLVSLLLALITYFLFPILRNKPGKIIMNLMVALILAQAILMVGTVSIPSLCILRATVLHFAWLAAFFWMSMLAGDLAYSMRSMTHLTQRHNTNKYKVVKLGVLAWGFPALFVSVCFLVSRLSRDKSWAWLEYGGNSCWIVDPLHSLLAFGVPVASHLIINCMLVAYMICKVIVNLRRLAAVQMELNVPMEFLLCLKLLVITGVTWSLFFAANVMDSIAFWYISVLTNSLQGTLIGMIFLLKENVKALWRQKLGGCCGCCGCRQQEGARPHTGNDAVPVTISGGLMRSLILQISNSSTLGEGRDGNDDHVLASYKAGDDVNL